MGIVLLSSILMFALLIQVMMNAAEEQSTLDIGCINNDESALSNELVSRLSEEPSLRMIKERKDILNELLLDEMIPCYFVIEKGYENNIKTGKLKGMISMYYLSNNESVSVISDIIAGDMMDMICFYKSLNYYQQLSKETFVDRTIEYENYMTHLMDESEAFNFAFDIHYFTAKQETNEGITISNVILYDQIIIGIIGMLIAFISMFLCSGIVKEKELGVTDRLKISYLSQSRQDIGNYITILLMEGAFGIVLSLLIGLQLNMNRLAQVGSLYLLILLYAFVQCGIFLMLGKMIKSISSLSAFWYLCHFNFRWGWVFTN